MQFSVFDDQPETIKKFEEDMKYVNSKLKMIDTKLSSIHPTNNAYVGKLKDTSNISCVNHLKNQEAEKKIEDLPNSMPKTSFRLSKFDLTEPGGNVSNSQTLKPNHMQPLSNG